ncbi:hypothetical protein FOCG_04578 [Fusarium oxysporum f. sp. radicis-lycopersici 26381]|uniref:Uncharacterized protein n=1 Tax=Fusarium oxysporum Fo47 TaxID=660027 RepID=W9K587_FUSOX|nr:hypothetical protein FOZG_09714 [Fusarium oxysporum Fo47]EWZ79354.1 hypothetical protein FOWG_16515 [Fusarium oxysporum f. sp. lycopersici MN25]EXL57346.1 hypothetical protein FOCG_04578 [Fusarium oxysporum f. sp. radicis-lycopersici 26381]
MSSSKRSPSQATTIDLLPAEELLRDLLLECRQQLATPELEVWITGGWNEASYQQRALDLGIEFKKFNGFHSTKKNLDKSKKLETAVGRIFGLDLDLVNLRCARRHTTTIVVLQKRSLAPSRKMHSDVTQLPMPCSLTCKTERLPTLLAEAWTIWRLA